MGTVNTVERNEVFGLIRPYIDAHTLGVSVAAQLLLDCGYRVVIGDNAISKAVSNIKKTENAHLLKTWVQKNRITRIGFSYRLDPKNALENFTDIFTVLKRNKLLAEDGGYIRKIY